MKRLVTILLSMSLGLALAIGATAGTAMRATHAVAAVGQLTITICGGNGAEQVTLDRDGNPVSPALGGCQHCPDCSLVPFAAPVALAFEPGLFIAAAPVSWADTGLSAAVGPEISQPRGPPLLTGV